MQMIALYYSSGYRVIFDNVSMMPRLLNIINWAYMLRDSRGGPLIVTTQYEYSSTLVYIFLKQIPGEGTPLYLAPVGRR